MSYIRPNGKESIVQAMKLIAVEGMTNPYQIKKIQKKIDKDSQKSGWTDSLIDSMDAEWQWRVCCARLQLGYLDWKGWEWRDPRPLRKDLPLWKGEKGKVLLHGEQGVGDEVLFAQCLPELLENDIEIFWECDPRLKSLFQRNFPVTVVGRDYGDQGSPEAEFRLPIGELPKLYRRKPFSQSAYLKPDPILKEKWGEWLKDKPNIGVSWKARQFQCSPDDLPNGINLQYDGIETEFTPPIDLKNDIEDIFAIISNLDKIVCVPTSILHFAGSMGVKVDTIMTGTGSSNNALNWRFGMGDKMPWHESVTIYRSLNAYNRRIS